MTHNRSSQRSLKRQSRAVAVAALVVAMLGLSACVPTLPSESQSNAADELDGFYDQELEYSGCMEFAQTEAAEQFFASETHECTYLDVPMDYSSPAGDGMQVAVLRVPAQGDPDERIGSLVINPGGISERVGQC